MKKHTFITSEEYEGSYVPSTVRLKQDIEKIVKKLPKNKAQKVKNILKTHIQEYGNI